MDTAEKRAVALSREAQAPLISLIECGGRPHPWPAESRRVALISRCGMLESVSDNRWLSDYFSVMAFR